MARTEVSEVVEKIRRQVLASYRTEIDVLAGLVDDEDTVLALEDATSPNLKAGAVINVGAEVMRVRSIDRTALEVTVIRGWGDSDADAHDADEIVWIEPRFTSQDIFDALRDEIAAWSPRLFRVYGDTLSVTADAETYELPVAFADALHLVTVRRILSDTTSTAWPTTDVRFQRGTTAWDGATTSGLLLRFKDPTAACSVYVEAALPFDADAITYWDCDLVDDIGLAPSMLDLLSLGVKMRLMVDAEIDRTSRMVQDDPRRSEEVPPTAGLQSANALRQLYDRRMSDEIARLARLYPPRWT